MAEAILGAAVNVLATAVVDSIVRPVRKHLDYHIEFNEIVHDFNKAQTDLQSQKEAIEAALEEQRRYVRTMEIGMDVKIWLREVEETLNNDARRVADEVRKAAKYRSRYGVGKRVVKITDKMNQLSEKVPDAPSRMAVPSTGFVSHDFVISETYHHLIGQEVGMIGLLGMGGTGKTYILKKVCDKLQEEDKFRKIIWINVTQSFDIHRLQYDIASQLNIDLTGVRRTDARAHQLLARFKAMRSYVLMLDDVWQEISLGHVGIPDPSEHTGCKIVLTTRSKRVAEKMDCTVVIPVDTLSREEAFRLFLSKVGEDVLSANPSIERMMKEMVEECRGLPIAIVTIAGAMKGIRDPLKWRAVLNELRRSTNNEQDTVFNILKLSYDALHERDRYCFLQCALYPEDYEIPKEEIIEYWIEGGLIDEMETREGMKTQGHFYLQRLLDSCLLMETNNNIVRMHDILRDFALSLIETEARCFVKAGLNLNSEELKSLPDVLKQAKDPEKVSLMGNFISELPPDISFGKRLTTLLLSHNSLEEIPESFFTNMHGLKYLDLSRNPIKRLPNSISDLENLTALLLSECRNLEELPSLSKLLALQKLNLEKTRIKEVPQGMEFLENLKYLNLRFISTLYEIPHGLLPKLQRLQHLAVHPTLSRPEEIMKLNQLENFEGRFADLRDFSKHFVFLREHGQRRTLKYFILVGKTVEYKLHSCGNFVTLKNCTVRTEGKRVLPSDVEELRMEKCNDFSSLNGVPGLEEATRLKKCRIEECERLESVFSSVCPQLETLESLVLRHLKNLNVLVACPIPSPHAFSSLKVLFLVKCPTIKLLFSTKLVPLQNLINLEQIIVWGCDQMEQIIASDEEGEIVSSTDEFTFPNLKELGLWHLPELKSICSTGGVMLCKSLEKLEIWNCPKLKKIPLKLGTSVSEDGKASRYPPLKDIKMKPNEWKSIVWDYPEAKKVFLPLVKIM